MCCPQIAQIIFGRFDVLEFNETDCKNLEISGTRDWWVVNGIGG